MTRQAGITVPADPSAVAAAREQVVAQVCSWVLGLRQEQQDALRLAASELITNAIVHGGPSIEVRLRLKATTLRLAVQDNSLAVPKFQHAALGDDENGRGLALVECLATRLGYDLTARGKVVWAEFEVGSGGRSVRTGGLRAGVRTAVAGLCALPWNFVLVIRPARGRPPQGLWKAMRRGRAASCRGTSTSPHGTPLP